MFTVITPNSFLDRLLIFSVSISCRFLSGSFVCNIFLCCLILADLLCLWSLFYGLQGHSSSCFWYVPLVCLFGPETCAVTHSIGGLIGIVLLRVCPRYWAGLPFCSVVITCFFRGGSAPCLLEWSEVKLLSCVWLFATPWAYHAPPSMGFSRQESWSRLPFPSPEDLPDPGIEPGSPSL